MRINKLVFKNIASYKGKYEIDFDISVLKKSGIFLISGNTGSGKSTILDCITLALYARIYRLDRNISDSISKGFESAYVRLTFTISGKIYESFIELNIRQKETPQNMVLNCISDGILIENKDDVLNYIKSLCRLDFEQFCQTVILPQGNFQEFLTSKPRSKTAIIDNIFNLKKYDDIEIFLKKELELTKFNKEKLQFLDTEERNRLNLNEKKLNELTNFLNSIDIKTLRNNLDNVYELIFICEKIIKFNQNYLDIQYRIGNLDLELFSKIKSKEKINHEYSLKEKIKLELDENLKFYNSNDFLDLKNFVKRHSELLNDKNRFLLELLNVQKDLEELKCLDLDSFNFGYVKDLYYENILFFEIDFDEKACDRLLIKESQLKEQRKELLERQKRKNIEIKSITSEETKFDFEKYVYYEALKLLKVFNEELILKYRNRLELLLNLSESDSSRDISITIKIDLYKEFLENITNNKQSVEKDIENLKYLEDEHEVYQGKEKLKMNSLNELLDLNSSLQILQSELDVIKQDVYRTKENKIKWEGQILNFKRNNAEILKRIGYDLFHKYIDYFNKDRFLVFEDKLKEVSVLKSILNDLSSKISLKEIEIEENLDKIKNLLSNINLNINLSNSTCLEREFAEFLRSKVKIENDHFKLNLHLNNVNNIKFKLESQIEFMEQTMLALEKDLERELINFTSNFLNFKRLVGDGFYVQNSILSLDSLKPSKNSLDYFLELKSNFMSQIGIFSRDISQYETSFLSLQTLQSEINEQKDNLENIRNELSSVNERNDKLEILKKVVTTSPSLKYYVQSFLINEILNISNKKYLNIIFPDFKLEINIDSRDFNFLVKSKRDGNMTRSVKTLSGGEKFLISLSLSLALSDMIRDSDLKIEAFFLDEGFGSLDEDTLKMVIPKISDLQRVDGRQIGIISHVSYLKEEIKTQIVISKISTVSKITIESF
ncbi:SMC family ATPase [Borrelia miyamotoi]|uniref:SMC family ATPase n=1 Tax=Borrelia miyamotoi TaxID=47466 RepID=A0AAX3JKU4_9SPIR|nr:SMC family ATPase [Borrelia miyamotoi]QFP41555.1 SMC family ATPase [Borrelia miyamotoi]QFP47677.1 SMC family ATPase [Borrelia miyamotoi]QGT55437.1 AAA family ATPase [Borrelia miyamotoi]QGT56219.1 AAA family ATPase [Borrelia miyamotoi]WAZ71461.1 SMC family ATPase [Borrelia miyamotoi]